MLIHTRIRGTDPERIGFVRVMATSTLELVASAQILDRPVRMVTIYGRPVGYFDCAAESLPKVREVYTVGPASLSVWLELARGGRLAGVLGSENDPTEVGLLAAPEGATE